VGGNETVSGRGTDSGAGRTEEHRSRLLISGDLRPADGTHQSHSHKRRTEALVQFRVQKLVESKLKFGIEKWVFVRIAIPNIFHSLRSAFSDLEPVDLCDQTQCHISSSRHAGGCDDTGLCAGVMSDTHRALRTQSTFGRTVTTQSNDNLLVVARRPSSRPVAANNALPVQTVAVIFDAELARRKADRYA